MESGAELMIAGRDVITVVDLVIGWTGRDNITHTRVVIGKRLKGDVLFRVDADPQATLPTQYQDLILRDSIIEFGTLMLPRSGRGPGGVVSERTIERAKAAGFAGSRPATAMQVPLQVLLELDAIDREDLEEAHQKFSRESLAVHLAERGMEPGEAPELLDDRHVRLAYGYEHNGVVYDLVEFGHRLTGMSEVRADRFGLKGARRTCFLAGLQIAKLGQFDGESEITGPIGLKDDGLDLEVFKKLDAIDIQAIHLGAIAYRESFRVAGKAVQNRRLQLNSNAVS